MQAKAPRTVNADNGNDPASLLGYGVASEWRIDESITKHEATSSLLIIRNLGLVIRRSFVIRLPRRSCSAKAGHSGFVI